MGSSQKPYSPTLLQISNLPILACFEGEGTSRRCFGVILTYEETTSFQPKIRKKN